MNCRSWLSGIFFGGASAEIVNALHRFAVVADARNLKRLFGRDEKCIPTNYALVNVFKRLIVPSVARINISPSNLIPRSIVRMFEWGFRD
jgi:hypothetical protein